MQGTRKFLFTPSLPLWRYCLLAWPIALVPSVALVAGAYSLLALAGANMAELGPPERSTTLAAVLGTVVFAPVVETLALAALLRLLSSLSENATLVAAASAVVWGCLHALFGALWFFGTVWSFFVFSCAYLAWRKASFRQALVAACVPHALVNLTSVALLFAIQAPNPSIEQTGTGLLVPVCSCLTLAVH
jgi:membrane protease YdiL (CAAX protease family)